MNKKGVGYTLAVLGAAVLIILIIILFSPNRCRLREDTTVEIPQGSSVGDIAWILKDEYVISGRLSFIARTVITGKKNDLKYGEFVFAPQMSYDEIIDTLCSKGAKRESITVTIPEGYSVEMAVAKLTGAGIGTVDEFETALGAKYNYEFLDYVNPNPDCNYALQGFLFPSTYEFYKTASAEDVINTMLAEFEKQYKKIGGTYENIEEIITKASLIEREAKLDAEREVIAGVIENRLNTDMPLQIDASVVYVISGGMYDVERVLYKDLEVESGYNTYKNKGLPTGPICNPGIKSIYAAMNPQKHQYLFYHTDTTKNDGSHIFSKTYEEHTK